MRGELKFEGTYKEGGQMIRSVDYLPVYEENQMVTPCVITSSVASTWQTTFYDTKTSRKKQLTTIEHLVVPGQNDMTSTVVQYFEGGNHTQVTRQTSTNSKGEVVESKNKYAGDYSLPCDAIPGGNQQYLTEVSGYYSQHLADLNRCQDPWCRRLQ
ncbi:MAG: hypothetical protein IPP99_04045 [Chitinophagaceae bacterium]|nr:hypothetical protein [Chitinophagaceae bacterium]